MHLPVFDSRDSRCKTPYGAGPCGTEVTLTLSPPAEERFSSCILVFCGEFANTRQEIPLMPAGREGECALFSGSFTAPDRPELGWYCFQFVRDTGETVWLGKNGWCGDHESVCWQLTVYDDTLPTPDWFGRGVTYQIFPDRFRRTAIPNASRMVGDRLVHRDWNELMEYLPDEKGEIRNRDFFGGSLKGIEEKLDYLKSLGVTTLYLCPIFESDSNHRYNTGDYEKIDPMLGDEADLVSLCKAAHGKGMRIMLDGVFNHTGSNSRYFNALGQYPTLGAAQSKESPYYDWYQFHHWPDRYESWWGIYTLPNVNETNPDYMDYIIDGENSIIRRWLRCGADPGGWTWRTSFRTSSSPASAPP